MTLFRTHILVALGVWLFSAGSAAQVTKDLADASLDELSQIQVYSASRHLQSASQAPSSVTVITADEIQKFGYRTLADVLRSVRGFYVSSDRMYSYLGARGFGRLGDYNTRVLLLIDGHRLNDSIYDQAMLGTEFPLDIDLIERIEVIRGPSSSLYGSNAFCGVISIITKTSHELQGLELSWEPSSFGTYKGRASYGESFRGADVLFSATLADSAGPTLFFPEFNSPATANGITRNANYDRYHDLFFSTSYHGFTLQGLDGWRLKGLPTGAYGTTFADPRSRFIDQHQYIDVTYKDRVRHGTQLFGRTYYDRYGFDGTYVVPGPTLNVDYVRGQTWGGEFQITRSWRDRHRLIAGTEIRDNFNQYQKNYDVSPPTVYLDSAHQSWVWAGYAQYEYTLNRHLTFSGGLRHDHYSIYGGSTNPRTALIYQPTEKTSFKFLFGRAFRAPNVYEAFYAGLGARYKLNPELQPEHMQTLEGGWEQRVGQHVQLTTTFFHNRLRRLISVEMDPTDGLLFFANLQAADTSGAEFEASARWASGFQGRASYTYTDTDNSATSRTFANAPLHLAKLNLIVPLSRARLFGSLEAQYTSSRISNLGRSAPAYPIFNVTLLGRNVANNLDLSASVYNLLDRTFFDPVSAELPEDRLQQDGRSFRIKLTWHWGGRQ